MDILSFRYLNLFRNRKLLFKISQILFGHQMLKGKKKIAHYSAI
jgi:hypothetical protein